MKYTAFVVLVAVLSISCKDDAKKIQPTTEAISESVYASGIVKSKNQYEAYSTVSGIIDSVFVAEGDSVKAGDPIFSISSETQRLNANNAELSASLVDQQAIQEKLTQAQVVMNSARAKMESDSLMYARQKALFDQRVGTKVDLELKQLAFQNSATTYTSALLNYKDLKRQLQYSAAQANNNLRISNAISGDYIIRSEIDGIVYSLNRTKGELIGPQIALAVIGDAKQFILEMQVDEYDILKIKEGLPVVVTFDSYKDQAFNATVTRVNPLMNERSKTFEVQAQFVSAPSVLYPNLSFEANIVLQTKQDALLIPRTYLLNDSIVMKSNGEKVIVKTGLMDFEKVEILSGITAKDELIPPSE